MRRIINSFVILLEVENEKLIENNIRIKKYFIIIYKKKKQKARI
jgi:hypothetical protein